MKYTQFCKTISSDSRIGPGLPSTNFLLFDLAKAADEAQMAHQAYAMMKPVVAVVPHPINDAGHQEKEGRGVTK